MATLPNDVVAAVFVAGLKNAHAVEHQALALIDRQLDHLSNYPTSPTGCGCTGAKPSSRSSGWRIYSTGSTRAARC
jgi:hypothetical protein